MKRILLMLTLSIGSFYSYAQVQAAGISPASIAGSYEFEWNEAADGWTSAPDLTVLGTFVEDTLMLISDGSPGTNAQGNPISAEACAGFPGPPEPGPPGPGVWNDLTGKIAVVYRNTCQFGYKALKAQEAGAVAVIIINRDPEVFGMLAGDYGADVTIPVISLSSTDGEALVDEMENGPVVFFIGNKFGLVANDIGSKKSNILIPKKGTYPKILADINPTLELGIELYNFGTNDNNITVNATIEGPSGVVYNNTFGPYLLESFDTLYIDNLEATTFPNFTPTSWEAGDYTVKYTIAIPDSIDEDPSDNVFESPFSISAQGPNGGVIAAGSSDNGELNVGFNPRNAELSYKACMFFEETFNYPNLAVEGFYFSTGIDTTGGVSIVGEDVFMEVNEWNDLWTDAIDENNLAVSPLTYQALNNIGAGTYSPQSEDEMNQVIYQPLNEPVILTSDKRYLMCLQTFNADVYFGADRLDYGHNFLYYQMPITPIAIDGTQNADWFAIGWTGGVVNIGLKLVTNLGVEDAGAVFGSAYPNPTNDNVTITVGAKGNAQLSITDVSGKIAYTGSVDLTTGKTTLDMSSLVAGMYIFSVNFDNGQSSRFNVVKN